MGNCPTSISRTHITTERAGCSFLDFSGGCRLDDDSAIFVEDAYKQYQTQSAFSAAILLACLGLVTLVIKEIIEQKTKIKDVS